jgi:phage terminase large subunit
VETKRIKATPVRRRLVEWLADPAGERVLIEEGGTRSGKTKNLCHGWAQHLHTHPGELLSIVRATGPALKATVRRDMIETLREWGLYHEENHNKTDDLVTLPGHAEPSIEFFATDDDQKVHGRKRHHLWANEANELDADTYTQLVLRTSGRVCMDFNPSMREDHWIWRRYDDDQNVRRHRSTYRDNPFLTAAQIAEIEGLRDVDEWAWQVYGLGLRGVPAESVFRDVQPLTVWPEGLDPVYGLDFGYNDPMCLQRVARRDREGVDGDRRADLFVWALLHESHLTTGDLIARLPDLGVPRDAPVYCDAAEPDRIEEIQRAGYNALPADKGPGSVSAGIDFLKRHRIHVGGPAAERARAEWRAYRWKKVRGVIQDAPAHEDSHAPDAGRYAAFTHWNRPVLDYARP